MKCGALAAVLSAGLATALFAIDVPAVVTPGSPLAGTLQGESERSLLLEPVELRDAAGGRVIASTRLFRLQGLTYGFVLGVPTDTAAGTYVVLAAREETAVEIGPREFRRARIRLDYGNSDLIVREDAVRDAENESLERLLIRFDPAAVRHTGAFGMPVSGFRRSSPFGEVRDYALEDGSDVHGVHRGVDLALPEGAEVAAPAAARVVLARWRVLTGNSVVLEHLPGVYSLYFHLSSLRVSEGQLVSAGDPVGLVGATGLATGPHLHWEMRVSGVPVDPEAFVAGGAVLPVDRGRPAAIMVPSVTIEEGR